MKISFDYTVINSDVTHLGLGVKITALIKVLVSNAAIVKTPARTQ